MNDARTQALALSRRGLSVIPVPAPDDRHDGKVPSIAWREYQTRCATDAELAAWFPVGVPMNVAIITGEVSGVVVVDVDSPAAMEWAVKRLPYTPWQVQTGKGFHLFYRHPGTRVANRARVETKDGRIAIDVRGDGGYVIAPGSRHASGATYIEAGDWNADIDGLPRFWPGWLERPRRSDTGTHASARPTGDVVDRARRYLAAIPAPVVGAGSDAATLYAACRLVRGFGLSANDAETLLWEWAGNRQGWTREWIAAKVRGAERYGTEPIGALR